MAWGNGERAVILRCGVEPPAPTTDACTTITTASGIGIDWIVAEGGRNSMTFTTYGRVPAVDVSVPRGVGGDQASAAVLDLAPLIASLPVRAHCLGPADG